MTRFKVYITCRDGGCGWGETGQQAEMTFLTNTPSEAAIQAGIHIPGGWVVTKITETTDDFYIRHIHD